MASVWYTRPVNIQSFSQDFSMQLSNATADGMTFSLQKVGTGAVGPGERGWGMERRRLGGMAGSGAAQR